MSNWYTTNLLQGNFSKNEAISFGPKSTKRDIDIVITDTLVESYSVLKLLGVSIDDQVNFKNHISEVTKRASKQVGVLVRLRNMIPRIAKLQICNITIADLLPFGLAFLFLIRHT